MKKYVLIVLAFITSLLCSIGASVWIILGEKTNAPNEYEKTEIQFSASSSGGEIKKPTLIESVTIPTFYYGQELDPNTYLSLVDVNITDSNNNTIPGSWSIDTKIDLAGANTGTSTAPVVESADKVTLTVTFIPTETYKYTTVSSTISTEISMYAVATYGSNYYSNIDYALKAAYTAGSGVITVLPSADATGVANEQSAKTIRTSTEIKSGVTLSLQHVAGAVYGVAGETNRNSTYRQGSLSTFADANSTNVGKYLRNRVIIDNGVEITLSGNLYIGGIVGKGASNQRPTGHVTGTYAEIVMNPKSTLKSTGTIDCLGYIKESSYNNLSSVEVTSGTTYAPFVIYDYRGGTNTSGAYLDGITPFNTFDIPNIQAKYIFHSGANLQGYAGLYARASLISSTSIHHLTQISLLSSDSTSLISLPTGAYLIKKYIPENNDCLYTTSNSKTTIEFYGGADLNAMSMNAAGQQVETTDLYFPMSWKYSFSLNDGSYNITKLLKVMSGAELTVNQSATLNISGSVILYPQSTRDSAYANITDDEIFYDDNTIGGQYPAKDPAKCIINGTVNLSGALGGNVTPGTEGAVLNISGATLTATSNEYTSGGGDTITMSATGNIFNESEQTASTSKFLNNTVYVSNGVAWEDGTENYATYTINYDANGGTLSTTESVNYYLKKGTNGTITALASAPTYAHHTFLGWYIAGTDTKAQGYAVSVGDEVNVYAKWREDTYDVTLFVKDANGQLTTETGDSFTVSNLPVTIPLPTGYTGWFLDESMQTELPDNIITQAVLDVIAKATGTKVILYGSSVPVVHVYFNVGTNAPSSYTAPPTQTVSSGTTFDLSVYSGGISSIDNDITQLKYFDGWTDADGNQYNADDKITIESDITLTANWANKKTISFTVSNATVKGQIIADNNSAVLYEFTSNATRYFIDTVDLTIAITLDKNNDKTWKIDFGDGSPVSGTDNLASTTYTGKTNSITINASSSDSCIVEGTLITLFDGSQKKIEDVTPNDVLLVFNHETGKYQAGQVLFTSHKTESAKSYRVVNLQFSDGSLLRIVASHGLFDLDLNKYVYVTEENATNYIGHRFYGANFNGETFVGKEIVLTDWFVTEETLRIFCPVTVFHMNCFAESLLTMPNIPYNEEGLVNFFEYGEGLKYDEEKMQADIEKYGLFTYEDFKDYFSYEAFIASPSKYLKIAMGKGLITFDEILLIIEYLLSGSYIS